MFLSAQQRQQRTRAAALVVARQMGLSAREAHLLHDSNNTVWAIRPAGVVVKAATSPLTRALGGPTLAREQAITLHCWKQGAPVHEPVAAEYGPQRLDGVDVILWKELKVLEGPEAVPWDTVDQLHEALRAYPGRMPHLGDHLGRLGELLAGPDPMTNLSASTRRWLREAHCSLMVRWEALDLPEQPLHGDLHLRNLLHTPDGPRWIDFESSCIGPREWDLVSTMASDLPSDADPRAVDVLTCLRHLAVVVWCSMMPERDPEVPHAARHHVLRLANRLSVSPVT